MHDRYADRIRIASSARKHGVEDADMVHAVDHPIRYREQEYQGEERILIIGADRVGRLLELVLVLTRALRSSFTRIGSDPVDTTTSEGGCMTRTAVRDDRDRDVEAFIDSIRPETMRDASRLRDIAAARAARDAADQRLTAAVAAARAASTTPGR